MTDKSGRKYGLILKKKPDSIQIKPSIFGGDDSGDEEGSGRRNVNMTIRKEAEKKKQMRQTQLEINKVLEEDPTAYDYDEVYDKMAERKANMLAAKSAKADKKPKYISNLLKFAEVRKKEEERRIERQVQKEREQEGSEFADKDAFVTSAYRKKMQEMAEEEERQRKQDERDGDVTKQTDLTKFYRNLLDRNVSTGGSYDTEQHTDAREDMTKRSRDSPSREEDARNEKDRTSEKERGRRERGDRTREKSERKHDERAREHDRRYHEKPKHKERKYREDEYSKCHREGDRTRERSEGENEKYEGQYDNEKLKRKERKYEGGHDGKSRKEKERTRESSNGKNDKRESEHDHEKLRGEERKQEEELENAREENAKHEVKENEKLESRKRTNDETNPEKSSGNSENANVERFKSKSSEKEKETSALNKFAKHSSNETVMSARERYLARKKTRVVVVQAGSDDEN